MRRSEPKPEPHRAPSPQLGPAQLYPMAGAVLGSCIGAPVGFLAGIKIGGLASLSGIIAGMDADIDTLPESGASYKIVQNQFIERRRLPGYSTWSSRIKLGLK